MLTITPETLLALGVLLLLGLATDVLGKQTALPRATLLVLLGVLLGPEVSRVIPPIFSDHFEIIASVALVMIGFLLGGRLTRENLAETGRLAVWISIIGAVGTALIVTPVMWLVGLPLSIAVLLGCIAAATDPAATVDVIEESGSDTRLSRVLVQVVALDDAWGLILFSLGLTGVNVFLGNGGISEVVLHLIQDLGGAVLLGMALGYPAAYLTGRIHPGRPMLLEALSLVLLCTALAMLWGVSLLIAAMVMGAIIGNLAEHHEYPFHEINGIEGVVMTLFFILAGASLDLETLLLAGGVGLAYVLARSTGKVIACALGAKLGLRGKQATPTANVQFIGLGMLPQAGAAIGMALIAAEQFPAYKQTILAVIVGTTVLFETIGPVLTNRLLTRNKASTHAESS
jgi:NhaP-type Na+/H+ or K+/H+ antiporter